jgi:hypothetical protein
MDTLILGREELWQIERERDRIYALVQISEEGGMDMAHPGREPRRAAAFPPRLAPGICCWGRTFRWNSTLAP